MIIRCDNCGSKYNNEAVWRCPICFPRKKGGKKKDTLGIQSFIMSDIKDKKRTSTGYSHRIKTGGGAC